MIYIIIILLQCLFNLNFDPNVNAENHRLPRLWKATSYNFQFFIQKETTIYTWHGTIWRENVSFEVLATTMTIEKNAGNWADSTRACHSTYIRIKRSPVKKKDRQTDSGVLCSVFWSCFCILFAWMRTNFVYHVTYNCPFEMKFLFDDQWNV